MLRKPGNSMNAHTPREAASRFFPQHRRRHADAKPRERVDEVGFRECAIGRRKVFIIRPVAMVGHAGPHSRRAVSSIRPAMRTPPRQEYVSEAILINRGVRVLLLILRTEGERPARTPP